MAYDVPFVVDFPAPDTRIGAPLPEGNGREKHLLSVLEVAQTFKEKGFHEAAKLVGEKAKTAEAGLLAKAAEKAKKLKADGGKTIANTAESAVSFVLNHLFGDA